MISFANKIKLSCITFFLDCILIYFLETQELNDKDEKFIYSMLLVHFLLYVSLYNSYYRLIDILHVVLFVAIFYAIYLSNIYLQFLVLFLIILIQILWIIEKDCIMNTKPLGFGYGLVLSILIIFYSNFLSFKMGQRISI